MLFFRPASAKKLEKYSLFRRLFWARLVSLIKFHEIYTTTLYLVFTNLKEVSAWLDFGFDQNFDTIQKVTPTNQGLSM